MREDKVFRQYFAARKVRRAPDNPWRSQPEPPASRHWQDEEKPGRFSWAVYALAAAGLALCLGFSLSNQYQNAIAVDINRAALGLNLHEQLLNWLEHCVEYFPHGII